MLSKKTNRLVARRKRHSRQRLRKKRKLKPKLRRKPSKISMRRSKKMSKFPITRRNLWKEKVVKST